MTTKLFTSSEPTFAPASTLSLPSGPPAPGKGTPPNRFIVFTDSWLSLQTYIQQGLKLPINMGEFNQKYGDFSRKELIKNCLDGMRSVNELSGTFGAPQTVKSEIIKNPNYLTSKTPPKEIYGHMIWLANQIQNSASTFSFTFSSLRDVLGQGTDKERADNLKMILMGPGGLVSTADDMKLKTQSLISSVLSFDKDFTTANNKILEYAGKSSEIMTETGRLIGQLDTSITETNNSAADAYAQWRNFTIAAVAAPIGILIITGGLCILFPPAAGVIAVVGTLAATGAAVGLTLAASAAMKNYNNLMAEVKKLEGQKQQKVRLRTDLQGLNSNIGLVTPALTTFKNNLDEINGVWTDVSMNLAYIVNNYSDQQLADLTWLNQTFKILDAQNKWKDISDSTRNFTQNSLVSYDTSINFGDQMNAPAA
jgi:hypothetical protein